MKKKKIFFLINKKDEELKNMRDQKDKELSILNKDISKKNLKIKNLKKKFLI